MHDYDLTLKFRESILEIADKLQEVLEEFPENNMGYDYLYDAQRYVNTVLDEYVVEFES